MKIDIINPGDKNYYDEFLFLVSNRKKVYSNLNTRISKLSYMAYTYLGVSLILFLVFFFWYLKSKELSHLYIVILFGILIILSIVYIFLIKNRISKLIKAFAKSIFAIDEKGVSIESNKEKNKLNYDEIKGMIIGKYTISFIPNDMEKRFITTRIEYKDELLKALKKYQKDSLIK